MLPSGAKYGLLIDLETCFNIKIDTNLDFNNSSGMRDSRRLVGSIGDLENDQSLANSEAAVRDVSPETGACPLFSRWWILHQLIPKNRVWKPH